MRVADIAAGARPPYRIGQDFERGLVWFRRDLRATDHAALHYALKHCRRVWCVFVFDRDILDPLLARGLRTDRRVEFIRESLSELDAMLRRAGGGLIVLHDAAARAIPTLARELDVQAVFANHDYEPAASARDATVRESLADDSRALFTFKDQVIFERDEILTGQGKPFAVFTPYRNAWLKALRPFDLRPYPIEPYLHALAPVPANRRVPPLLGTLGFAASNLSDIAMPTGASGGQALFEEFTSRMGDYGRRRDYPALRGPSYLSVHLRFGTVSIRTLARAAHEAVLRGGADSAGAATWLSELVWRDFYFMILHHHPRVAAGKAFNPAYDAFAGAMARQPSAISRHGVMRPPAIRSWTPQCCRSARAAICITACAWSRPASWSRTLAWTGAAANSTLRPAQRFRSRGQQWRLAMGRFHGMRCAAVVPHLQSCHAIREIRPAGRFIRKYLPQLAALPDKYVHAPWTAPHDVLSDAGVRLGDNYPRPLVQHDVARKETLERYTVVKTAAGKSTAAED